MTKLGIGENLEGALAYLLGPITGFVLLVVEKENKFVRFHAMQSFLTTSALIILKHIVRIIPFLGNMLSNGIGFVYFITVVFLIATAFSGKEFKIPFVGDIANKQIYK